ncbi:ferric iron reductase FhuF-like transporter [Streptomyces puniciscabiei]|uniref:Ferric iron reductase FhuF-like transporter n=1 Tax=Streptomyces puniciscabiei TaxID=164348 RepID=A0A542SZR8_9ACTN|nr:(2Fe-2S)-binding protein [Streptomyces puniciscabiei]TQK80058.1 ferric iron reductase FhuF-like transporter [Streptomyces puniciscabiei]
MDLDPALAALRPLGGFFVLRTVPGPAAVTGRPDPGRLPTLAETYARVTPDALGARVAVVADRLRTREPRVAASIAHQGLAARLWSAALGCAVRYGRLPDLDPRLLRWDPLAAAPDDLCLTELRPLPGDAAGLAAAVLHGHLEPLTEALRTGYGSAPGLLWGNAGSALAGAARELDRWARAHGRTDLADRARALTDELFAHPLLRSTGTRTGTAFRRRSCCLYYRVPGGGVCGDCCFTRPPGSSPGAASG